MLSGVNVTIQDHQNVTIDDLSANYFVSEDNIGQNVSLFPLNPSMWISMNLCVCAAGRSSRFIGTEIKWVHAGSDQR